MAWVGRDIKSDSNTQGHHLVPGVGHLPLDHFLTTSLLPLPSCPVQDGMCSLCSCCDLQEICKHVKLQDL